jgi:hypothetical protein
MKYDYASNVRMIDVNPAILNLDTGKIGEILTKQWELQSQKRANIVILLMEGAGRLFLTIYNSLGTVWQYLSYYAVRSSKIRDIISYHKRFHSFLPNNLISFPTLQ